MRTGWVPKGPHLPQHHNTRDLLAGIEFTGSYFQMLITILFFKLGLCGGDKGIIYSEEWGCVTVQCHGANQDTP